MTAGGGQTDITDSHKAGLRSAVAVYDSVIGKLELRASGILRSNKPFEIK